MRKAARIVQASGGIAVNWINLTDTCRRAGLPVESVVHLNAGDPGLALQVVARITGEGHRVAGLLALSAAASVHGRPRVPAGGRHMNLQNGNGDQLCSLFTYQDISAGGSISRSEMRLRGLGSEQWLTGGSDEQNTV